MTNIELLTEKYISVERNIEDICMWKKVYYDNMRGKGTTFDKLRSHIGCEECNGFQTMCNTFIKNRRIGGYNGR